MLGRQSMLLSADELVDVCTRFGLELDPAVLETSWAERFFEALGAKEVASLDGSDYEGAGIVHDLNQPVPAELHGRFTAVVDGGTLEHVFNAPIAFANVASLLEAGGHALHINPGNNYLGHGFYQFSPEFYWRALPACGLEVERVLFKEEPGEWYEVADPAKLGRRVELDRGRPGLLYVLARKVSDGRGQVFQADYTVAWEGGRPVDAPLRRGAASAGGRRLDARRLRRILGRIRRGLRSRDAPCPDPGAFRKVEL